MARKRVCLPERAQHYLPNPGKTCEMWGERKNHPLRQIWQSRRREAVEGKDFYAPWGDFVKFIEDVEASIGTRPEGPYRFSRIDHKQPWSPTNIRWRKTEKYSSREEYLEARNKMSAAWHKQPHNLVRHRDVWLRRKFRITLEEFLAIKAAQGGVCAVCKNPERRKIVGNEVAELCVDHCHDTGEIRGLLCSTCNSGIGHLGDTEEALERALEYLRAHRRKTISLLTD